MWNGLETRAPVLPGEGVFRRRGAFGQGGFLVGGEVGEAVVDVLCIGADGGGEGLRGLWGGVQRRTHVGEDFEEGACRGLACFDAGLVVGVDVDEAGVEGNGSLKEGDEHAEGEGGDLGDGDGEGTSSGFVEGFAGAAKKSLEEVGGGVAGFDFDAVAVAAFADFDEGGEEVVHAVAELLDVGVLVGGTFVAIDGDALVDFVAVEVEFLAERLHDELLEIFGEEDEGVLVWEDDHVLLAFAVAFVVPGEGELEGGVVGGVVAAGFFIHGRGAGEHGVEVDALKGHGDESDGGKDGGAAADPIRHGERGDEAGFFGEVGEFGAVPGDGDGLVGEAESGAIEGVGSFEHAVAGFGSASGFGDDDGEGAGEVLTDVGEGAVHAGGVGVVEEVGFEGGVAADGIVDELGAEGGSADADDEEGVVGFAGGGGDLLVEDC